MEKQLKELAEYVKGELEGDDLPIRGAAGIKEAEAGDITFAESKKMFPEAEESAASAVLVPRNLSKAGKSIIKVDNPRLAFARIMQLFYPPAFPSPGIHKSAVIGQNSALGKDIFVGANVVIGDDVKIGDGTRIFPGVVIGDGVKIGDETILYPNVVLQPGVRIGNRVTIHSGAVIGTDGFGFVRDEQGSHYKIPQVGDVEIQDDVEIGANTAIDRATTGTTLVGKGTKIDNLVMLGHNVRTGKNCIMVAQVGVAGSTEMGDDVTLAAQAGVGPHVKIGSGAIAGGQAGVTKDIPPGVIVSGYPARPHREALKIDALMFRLPELYKKVDGMAREIEELKKKLQEG